jgi:regulatory protein
MPERDPVELAARSLQHRDRSRRDVEQRLARAGIGEAERAEALATLERVGYLDDARFARSRAEALAGRELGDRAIRAELEQHGVPAEAIESAIEALPCERERAEAVLARRGRSVRTARYLARKGFGEDALEAAFAGSDADDGPEGGAV